jgi:phage terminase small subunit
MKIDFDAALERRFGAGETENRSACEGDDMNTEDSKPPMLKLIRRGRARSRRRKKSGPRPLPPPRWLGGEARKEWLNLANYFASLRVSAKKLRPALAAHCIAAEISSQYLLHWQSEPHVLFDELENPWHAVAGVAMEETLRARRALRDLARLPNFLS